MKTLTILASLILSSIAFAQNTTATPPATPAAAAPTTTAEAPAVNTGKLTLTIENHVFTPAEIHVPANKPASIEVTNKDATAEEFDSDDLHVEKVVAGKSKGTVRLRALKPGKYNFKGEYHEDTAKGVVVAE